MSSESDKGGIHPTIGPLQTQARGRLFLLVFDQETTRAVDLPASGRLIIGRSAEADIVLKDESVSRKHAEILVLDAALSVRDLGSKNGTLVDGQAIAQVRRVQPGQTIHIGSATLAVGDTRGSGRRPLLDHAELEARAQAELEAVRGSGGCMAVLLIRAPGARDVEVGVALREVLGEAALVGSYGGGHYQAALGVTDPGSGELGLKVRGELARRGLAAEVGAACCPADGCTWDALTAGARANLRVSAPAPVSDAALVAEDPAFRQLLAQAQRVASGKIPVLILGATGTGKGFLAEAIHAASPRARGPFVRVNCAALPEPLLEAELFGHEKGAFTGAVASKAGLIEAAEGGTLLLDEVGELPAQQQAKLLHALEDGTVRRLGGHKDRRVDVRVIAATNRDLEQAAAAGLFRQDLYFRLGGTTLTVPPLRQRPRDVVAFARRFARRDDGAAVDLAPETERLLLAYAWPGNVRELRNAIERALLLCEGETIMPGDLPDRVRLGDRPVRPTKPEESTKLNYDAVRAEMRDVERARIVEALAACGWNQTQAALRLGISRRTLVSKIAAYGIRRR